MYIPSEEFMISSSIENKEKPFRDPLKDIKLLCRKEFIEILLHIS